MTRREKIIVGLMIAAGVGAAIDFTIGRLSSSDPKQDPSKFGQEVVNAVTLAQTGLATTELSPLRKQIITDLADPWDPELLLPRQMLLIPENGSESETEPGIPIFTGYLEINGKPFAIIDGRDYTIGEWLTNEKFQLIRILPDKAELKPAETEETIIIPITTGESG